jgi:hypothetical protein
MHGVSIAGFSSALSRLSSERIAQVGTTPDKTISYIFR